MADPRARRSRLKRRRRVAGAAMVPALVLVVMAGAGSSALARVPTMNPCNLLTAKQVATVTRKTPTRRVRAPLGPTCIFYFRNRKLELNVSVQSTALAKVTRSMRDKRKVSVRRHVAYCGKVGNPVLYVSLPKNKVLVLAGDMVTLVARCGSARALAAIALPHVKS